MLNIVPKPTLFGIKVKMLREAKNYSIEVLASKSGISGEFLYSIENEYGIPVPHTVRSLADALELPFESLILDTEAEQYA